jgi:hypothetical protein
MEPSLEKKAAVIGGANAAIMWKTAHRKHRARPNQPQWKGDILG